MSAITEILDRLSGIEVVKEKLQDTGHRIETYAEIAKAARASGRALPKQGG